MPAKIDFDRVNNFFLISKSPSSAAFSTIMNEGQLDEWNYSPPTGWPLFFKFYYVKK